MVGAIGFEPTTSWSQTRRSTRLSYTPPIEPRWDARTPAVSMAGWWQVFIEPLAALSRLQKFLPCPGSEITWEEFLANEFELTA